MNSDRNIHDWLQHPRDWRRYGDWNVAFFVVGSLILITAKTALDSVDPAHPSTGTTLATDQWAPVGEGLNTQAGVLWKTTELGAYALCTDGRAGPPRQGTVLGSTQRDDLSPEFRAVLPEERSAYVVQLDGCWTSEQHDPNYRSDHGWRVPWIAGHIERVNGLFGP